MSRSCVVVTLAAAALATFSCGRQGYVVVTLAAAALATFSCGRQGYEVVDCWPRCSEPVLALSVEGQTPHSVTWSWDADALGPDVLSYHVRYAPEGTDLAGPDARLWTQVDDPNLGWRWSPYGPNLVYRTTVAALESATSYRVELWAWFADGTASPVAAGEATTFAVPSGSIVMFDEVVPAGGWLIDFQDPTTSGHAHSGTNALWVTTTGSWIGTHLGGLAIDITGVPTARWGDAYIEFYVDIEAVNDDVEPVYYAEVQLSSGAASFAYNYPQYIALAARSGWQRIEVPLASINTGAGTPFSSDSAGGVLDQFQIGAAWASNRRVWVDDVVIRY